MLSWQVATAFRVKISDFYLKTNLDFYEIVGNIIYYLSIASLFWFSIMTQTIMDILLEKINKCLMRRHVHIIEQTHQNN